MGIFLFRKAAQVEEISNAGFTRIEDTSLQLVVNTSKARVRVEHRAVYPSAYEIFENVFGKWVREKILPVADHSIAASRSSRSHSQAHLWKGVSYEQLMEFFLILFVDGELNNIDKGVDKNKVHSSLTWC